MFRSRLFLRNSWSVAHSRKDRRRLAHRNRKPIRRVLEALEDRINPGPIILTAADGTQLQTAINTANSNPTQQYNIQLTSTGPYNLTSDQAVSNTAGVTIAPTTGTNVTINAASGQRLFTETAGANFTLTNVTLQGGSVASTSSGGSKGGAILDAGGGGLTLTSCTVGGYTATGTSAEGGGVFVSGGGALTLTSTTFSANTAKGSNTAAVTVPASTLPSLQTGNYQLIETYTDTPGSPFAGSSSSGTLSIAPTLTTGVSPGNASLGTGGGTTTIPVVVNSIGGTVNSGTVTIALVNGGSTTVVGSAPVSGGVANVTVSIPALAGGSYQLIESYADSTGHFLGSSAFGTLSIAAAPPPPPPPSLPLQVAALEVAIDSAALTLQGNSVALFELQLFADVFLQYQIPATIPELMGAIQSTYPQTSVLGLASIDAGRSLAQNILNNGTVI